MIIGTHKIFLKERCSEDYLNKLIIINPSFTNAARLGFSTKGIPETLLLYKEETDDGGTKIIKVPRNFPLNPEGFDANNFIDLRTEGEKVELKRLISPYERQKPAVEALEKTNDGILIAPCGSGKTIMGSLALTAVGVKTLILVHKSFLVEQWMEAIKTVTGEKAGLIQGSTWDWEDRKVVIGMLQTLHSQKNHLPKGFIQSFGLVISDEVHRISAPTWVEVIELFPAKRRWGLTATPKRSDGLELVFHAHMGDIVYRLEGTDLKPKVYMVQTKCDLPTEMFVNKYTKNPMIARLITSLTEDRERNKKILKLLIDAAKSGRKIILLTERVAHAEFLKKSFDLNMQGTDITSAVYIGALGKEARKEAEKADVLLATTQIAKEALNIPDLDTLFIASPFSSAITTEQSVGRILRACDDKMEPMVIDFVDEDFISIKLARKRYYTYQRLKYDIKLIGGTKL